MEKGLSLVVPCHNSEMVIKNSVKEFFNTFSRIFKKFEIIIVCNDCWDRTAEISRSLEKDFPLRTFEIAQRGKGHALNKGFNVAQYDILGFIDADNPFDLKKISGLVDYLKKVDVSIVTKYSKGGAKRHDSQLRRIISLCAFIVSRTFFNMHFRDTQAGAKFFHRRVWEKVKFNWKCTGFDWDIEFLYKSIKNKFKIVEVYIPFKYEKFSTFRLKYIPGIFKRILKLRFLE